MGTFVLGILVGWLAEWIFFSFWIKGRSTGEFADCTAFKNEVSRKNTEISALKTELENAKKSLSDATKEKSNNKKEAKASKSNSTAAVTSTVNKSAAKKTAAKQVATKKAVSNTKSSAATSKSAPKKAVTKTKAAPKSKTADKKAAPKKVATKKPANTKATTPKSTKNAKTGDDLTKLSGIGPSMASTLNELGINTFKKLADMDDDILRDMLEASGARLNNNKEAMDTWNEQAALADKGDMAGLKKLQESLKK